MANYSARILNNAISGLNAQQAVIATTANNIANANTPGYSKRKVDLQDRVNGTTTGNAQLAVGSGVEIKTISRATDIFLEKLLRQATGDKQGSQTTADFVKRIDGLFSLTGDSNTIGKALTDFFSAANDVAANPSSIEIRTNFLQRAQDLTTSIQSTYKSLAALQSEADSRVETEVQSLNSITASIADLNGKIANRESNGSVAADERDKRDQLLQQLAEKIDANVVETSDGSVTISLNGGFVLVNGANHNDLGTSKSPSFSGGTVPPSLDGGALNFIVYDYTPGGSATHIDLTSKIAGMGGTIGALLNFRGVADAGQISAFSATGTVVDVAARVEAIARGLLSDVNTAYLGSNRVALADPYQPTAGDLDGNVPATYGLFSFAYSGNRDTNSDGQPQDLGNHGIDSYAKIIDVTSMDPRKVAAALDVSGVTVGPMVFQPGDGRNMTNLANTQFSSLSLAVPNFSFTGTLDQAYNELVGQVSNVKSSADLQASVAADNYNTAANRRDEVAAVSLDEEFTSLIQSQRAYQASARMIKVADDLLTQLMNSI